MNHVNRRSATVSPIRRCFHFGMTLPNESAIASSGPETVWRERLAHQLFPAYVGKEVFEDVVRQAYQRHRSDRNLPAFEQWGRWQGRDRNRQDIEIDIVARLLDGRVMTGSAKFRHRAAGAVELLEHIDALKRLAVGGRSWAREAFQPDAPMLFVIAAGFKDSFHQTARDFGKSVITWTIEDLFIGRDTSPTGATTESS